MFGFGRFCKKYYRDLKNLRRFVKELRQISLDELKAEKISLIDRLEHMERDRRTIIDQVKSLEDILSWIIGQRGKESMPKSYRAFMLSFDAVPALANEQNLRKKLILGFFQNSIGDEAFKSDSESILNAARHKENIIDGAQLNEQATSDLKIELDDATLGLDIITRYLFGQRVPESTSST